MKYLITFSYNGSKFYGYQKQPDKISIQEEIESKLTQINSNNFVSIHASGRTDAGVHANNQKAHFELLYNVDEARLKYSLNKMLNNYIYVKKVEKVDNNFHARFNVTSKKYIYKINMGEYNPIERDYIYQYCNKLDVDKIKEACSYLIGKHNFKSFTKATDIKEDYNRTIFEINVKIDQYLNIEFIGDGFMRYMIRNIVGTLITVGESKIEPVCIKNILIKEDRKEAGFTAPAEGLYLDNVYYN